MSAGTPLMALVLMLLARGAPAVGAHDSAVSDDIEVARPAFVMLFSPPKAWGFDCPPEPALGQRRGEVAAADEALSAKAGNDVPVASLLELGRSWRCLAWAELDVEDPPELPSDATDLQKMERMDRMTAEPLRAYEQAKARSCFWLTQPLVQQAVASPELEQTLCSSVLWECYSDTKAMAATVSRLAELFPNSLCRWPAEVTLADAWFSQGMLEPAMKAFRRVEAAAPRPDWTAYARYRQAWVNFNLGQFQPALEGLAHAISDMAACPSEDPKEKEQFRRISAAMCDDLPVLYAAVGQAEKARAFVERLAGERTGRVLMELANRYRDLGQCDAAQVVVQSVLPLLPNRIDRLGMKTLRAECAAGTTDSAARLAALEGLADELVAELAAGDTAEEGSAKAMLRVYYLQDAEKCLYRACADSVKEARSVKAAHGFEAALTYCRPYLHAFPTQGQAAEVHRALGGLASDLSLFAQAIDHLEACINLGNPGWTTTCRTALHFVCDHPGLPAELHERCPGP